MSEDLAKLKKHLYEIVNNKGYLEEDKNKRNSSIEIVDQQMNKRRINTEYVEKNGILNE